MGLWGGVDGVGVDEEGGGGGGWMKVVGVAFLHGTALDSEIIRAFRSYAAVLNMS